MERKFSLLFVFVLTACATKSPYLQGLECGTDQLWKDHPVQSVECFDAAETAMDTESNYVVKDYEKVMLKTYQGVGFMAGGGDFAAQSFRRAYALQTQIVQENSADIAKQQEEFKKSARKIPGMPGLNEIVNEINAEMDMGSQVLAMRDYVNPYTTWLSAIYDGVASRDFSNAENFLRRVATFAPDNKFVRTDMDAIRSKKEHVWIVFENGIVGRLYEHYMAPRALQAWNINLTVPDQARGTVALPYLEIDGIKTEFLADVDSIVKTDLIKYRTEHIISSVVFEVGKLAAAGGVIVGSAVAANKNRNAPGLFMMGGYLATKAIMSVRKNWDLRSWDSLPAEIQVARIEMPQSREVKISNVGNVKIPTEARNAIVFVRILTQNSTPAVIIGKLN
ncbi:MAG: hypothetical protein FWE50_03575 [Alphaproteobacteria bacterium]|nr:hypothetical protein [Alphaproteobacteria bacterium]